MSTLRCHSDVVRTVHFDGKFLASGSEDMTIKVFNFQTRETFALRGHQGAVLYVRVHAPSRTLFSSSEDTTIRMVSWIDDDTITYDGITDRQHYSRILTFGLSGTSTAAPASVYSKATSTE